MVQGGLVTAHPGSAHGGGEALEGQSSLRQGAGTGSSGCPDLPIVAAAEQRKISRKGFRPEGFWNGCKYRPKGGTGGGPSSQVPCWRGQEGGAPPGRLGGP